ncbi:hypothetical protein [Streptomyces sp. NPDC002564]|uniref:hypothetical protein n=1 Tax=Streptomyces sp. NPDC002564 TaxID=3364649 RepID=UPI0036D1FEB3
MVRNVLGSVLALAGATAAVLSPFRAWYDGRHGRDFRLDELFSGAGVTDAGAELFGSLFLPFAFAALLTLVGVVLRARLPVALAGVLVLGFTVLWMVRQGQAEGSLAVAGDGSGLGQGVLGGLCGGVALLLGAALMTGRTSRASRASRTDGTGGTDGTVGTDDRYGPSAAHDPTSGSGAHDAHGTSGAVPTLDGPAWTAPRRDDPPPPPPG